MLSIKVIDASLARNITHYKNLKRKILKCCANIYFNKQCQKHNLTPKYTQIKIPLTSPAAIYTQRKVNKIRIKDKIKFLYLKKDKLNKQLYKTHLKLAHECDQNWRIISELTDTTLNTEIQRKYHTLHKKLYILKNTQTPNTTISINTLPFTPE